MQRRTARATGWSVVLHVSLVAAVLLIRPHAGEGPSRMSIIDAELLFDAGAGSSATDADTEKDGATAARSTADPEAPEPTAPDEPATEAAVADANVPAPAEQAAETTAEPSQRAEPPESIADAADAPTLAAADSPAAADAADPAEAPTASLAAADSPAAAAAVEPQLSSQTDSASAPPPGANEVAAADTAAEALDATLASSASAGAAAAAATAAESPPGVAMASRERQMIAKRFAAWNGRFTPGAGAPSVDWKQNGQAYTAVFRAPSAADPMGLEHIAVDVSTEQGGKKMSTQLTMTRLAFSNFAQFVDKWDPNVQIHDDVIDGRFHSNTPINLLSSGRASPVFLGKVTIASHDLEADTKAMPFNRRKVFPEGVDTGVRRILLPSHFLPLLNDAATGDESVQRFERDARITFYADGTYGWSYIEHGAPEERRPVTAPAHYLVGLEGATLRVKGTLNGKVLVYSAQRIVIEDDLRYADARAHDADDYLGLVAESDVEIAESEVTGLGDLEVDASIYARRRFAVRDFRSRPSGTLVIYGSVTAGSITATEPRFATKIEFDRRLTNARPPSFPLTDRYELDAWDGEWRVGEPAGFAGDDPALAEEDPAGELGENFAEASDDASAR